MAVLEAVPLPAKDAGNRRISLAVRVQPRSPEKHPDTGAGEMRAKMKGQSIPGVLLLHSSEPSGSEAAQENVRHAARSAGLSIVFNAANRRRDFLERLRAGSVDAILVLSNEVLADEPAGLIDMEFAEVIERARAAEPSIPVIVIGESRAGMEALRHPEGGPPEAFPSVLQSPNPEHLPTLLACALKVRQAALLQAQAQQDLERTAVTLRENQKLITIGRLAASIAHEINNPLESVTNLLYLLGEEQALSQSAHSYLSLARRELDRVAQISRQTLNFSRETAGPVHAHIQELLEEVLSLYGRRIMEKNLRVQRQYDCAEEAIVYPGEMRQVLSNLITNAVEASSRNGLLRIRVRCTRSWSDPGVRGVRVSIGDTGTGIAPDVQRRLGEPFFTTKGQRGTGLGLWVTRSIVQRYGGEIQLRSSIDPKRHGTVFSIFLPTNLRPHMVDRSPNDVPAESASRSTQLSPSQPEVRRPSAQDSPRRQVNGH